ncbi:NAD(P)-dependent alcohol dehydrogenase [Arenibacter echinorum]|uniref:NADPH:quinone reductase-like Zn-dependent oxidoreductase n=1 Tax=Arenibacter echinorum TaxID=440515 RepID=A0A327RDQ9_9FLAO|nr:NAD(P)-dependent alcohol dehydrogenase [Arenibacter echinorum]RAJ13674.1 NADPH:quinone reductase-like Zn-dependent oxidoreductase [Arenibacter echinorum]
MKAIICEAYGLPEKVVKITERPTPSPKDNEVLIKIHATAVNDYDWSLVLGKPYLIRLMFGLLKPKHGLLGMELSGTIVAMGAKATKFKIGDAVMGDTSEYGFGTFAEYISINEKAVIQKPQALSFEEAAAIPHASCLALQALRDIGQIKEGQKILINGGGGGVGTIGLQLAKLYNCEVTGVDSQEKLAMMTSLGYNHVIDYKKVNFTKAGETYDLILDCKTNKAALSYLKALKPNGAYVTIGGKLSGLLKVLLWGKFAPLFSSKKLKVLALKTNIGLDYIIELLTQHKIQCQIDGPYPLEDAGRLIQYFGDAKHKGKIVMTTNP